MKGEQRLGELYTGCLGRSQGLHNVSLKYEVAEIQVLQNRCASASNGPTIFPIRKGQQDMLWLGYELHELPL